MSTNNYFDNQHLERTPREWPQNTWLQRRLAAKQKKDCGECDPLFPCHNGQQRCIREPYEKSS